MPAGRQDRLDLFGETSRPETTHTAKRIDERADRIHAKVISGDIPRAFG